MGRTLDWFGSQLAATGTFMSAPAGALVSRGLPSAWEKGSSLLRGRGRNRTPDGVPSFDEDMQPGPQREAHTAGESSLGVGDNMEIVVGLTNIEHVLRNMSQFATQSSGEIIKGITNIETILRGMSELATEASVRDVTEAENQRQARESFHRIFEQQEETETPSSIERVKEEGVEKKEGSGILSSLWNMLGPKSKLMLGLGGLGLAGLGAKKLWDWAVEDDGLIGNVARGIQDSFTTIRDSIAKVFDGWWDTIKEKIGIALSSLDWGEALRLSAAVALPVTKVASPLLRATAWGMDKAGAAGSKIAGAGSRFGKFLGFGKQAAPGAMRGAAPGTNVLQGLSNPAVTREATKGTSALSKIGNALGGIAKRAPGLTRALGTGLKFAGRVARPLAVGLDVHKLQSMEDESARKWQKWAIGLGVAGLAAGAIAATGGLATPFVAGMAATALGIGGAGASIVASRKEDAALAEAGGTVAEPPPLGDSPTRISEPEAVMEPSEKEAYLHEQLAGAGYSYDQAEGIIENLRDESGLREGVVGDTHLGEGEEALGIAQWRLDRKENMLKYAEQHKELNFFQAQVGFLIKELKETRGGGTTGSPQGMPETYAGAHNWVLQHYERPHKDNVQARWVDEGTSAPGAGGALGNLYAGRMAVDAVAPARNAERLAAGPDAANEQAPTAAAAVNYNDNRVTNNHANVFHQLPNAQNPDASLREAQYQQGLTVAPA